MPKFTAGELVLLDKVEPSMGPSKRKSTVAEEIEKARLYKLIFKNKILFSVVKVQTIKYS